MFNYTHYIFKLSITLVIILLSVNCHAGNKLSRSSAEKMIENYSFEMKSRIYLHEHGLQAGKKHNLLTQKSSAYSINLTERGAQYIDKTRQGYLISSYIFTKYPLEIDVKVTGIADAQLSHAITGVKEAQFEYFYTKVPSSPIKWIISAGGKGKAFFRLYDDGWRIEKIEGNSYFTSPVRLSQKELATKEMDLARIAVIEAEAERQAALKIAEESYATDKLNNLRKQSKKATKRIGTYPCMTSGGIIGGKDKIDGEVILTDVGSYFYRDYGKYKKKAFFWFGNIRSMSKYDDDPKYSKNGHFVRFKLRRDIWLRMGDSVDRINFVNKQIRDQFFDEIVNAKAEWEEQYKDLGFGQISNQANIAGDAAASKENRTFIYNTGNERFTYKVSNNDIRFKLFSNKNEYKYGYLLNDDSFPFKDILKVYYCPDDSVAVCFDKQFVYWNGKKTVLQQKLVIGKKDIHQLHDILSNAVQAWHEKHGGGK